MRQKRTCEACKGNLTYSRKLKQYVCKQCLFGAFLTDQSQRAAVKRYRQSEKGKATEKTYEQTEKGKITRNKYLKSEKYKQRRREYNQRLKESLAIARAALPERAKKITPIEMKAADERLALISDIREYIDSATRSPSPSDVKTWAETEYKMKITIEEAANLIQQARKH